LSAEIQRGRLCALGAAFCWSSGGALVKIANKDFDGWQIAGFRALFAFLFLFLMVRAWRARPLMPNLKVIVLTIIYAVMLILFILANTLTTSANAIFLQDSAPLWVLLFSTWLLKEKLRLQDIILLAVCGVGLGLFFVDDLQPGQSQGNILALVSGLGYALVIVGLRWGRHKSDGAEPTAAEKSLRPPSDSELILVWGNLTCFVACLFFMGPLPADFAKPMGAVAFMGVFQLGLGYYLLSRSVNHVPAVEASLLTLLEPVLNPIWTYFAVGEKPGPFALLGGAIIIGGVAYSALRDRGGPVKKVGE
jgi:DME family drug/metabolite transporter